MILSDSIKKDLNSIFREETPANFFDYPFKPHSNCKLYQYNFENGLFDNYGNFNPSSTKIPEKCVFFQALNDQNAKRKLISLIK